MKFQRNTVILVSVAAILSVAVLISEAQRSRTNNPSGISEVAPGDRLFSFEEADITQLTIEKDAQTLVFERDDNSNWQMLEPEAILAEQAAIAFLLNLVTTSGPSSVFSIEPDEQSDFGLDAPTAIITLTLASGDSHTLLLGAADFSGGSLYAVVDPDLENIASTAIEVEVVPIDFVNAVTRPLDEWQATVEAPAPDGDNAPSAETEAPPSEADPEADPAEAEVLPEPEATESSDPEAGAEAVPDDPEASPPSDSEASEN